MCDHAAVPAPPELWLASTSPRRRELLQRAGIPFGLCEPGAEYVPGAGDEHRSERGDPQVLACARAVRKGDGARAPDAAIPVLAVDTVVDLDGVELGKPRDVAEAERMLRALAGRQHRVHTAHYLRLPATGRAALRVATAVVACGQPVAAELQRYLDSQQWRGKAGSYGVQDDAQGFFRVVDGAFDTVVGLHVPAVRELLTALRGSR
jgi:septum formation protein